MINLQAKIFSFFPEKFKYSLNLIRILPRYFHWFFSKIGRIRSKAILSQYKDKYIGYRCVIIGNGPSLKDMDLSILKDEYTFGLNRIYILFKTIGFNTTFLVSINRLVLAQFGREISKIKTIKILNWSSRNEIDLDNDTVLLSARPIGKNLDGEITNGYMQIAGSVTNVALELAFYMGFSEVILIGVDHNYSEKGLPGKAIISKAPDKDHFTSEYFGKGITWQLPDYTLMEYGYRDLNELFVSNGRSIVDATVGGKLQIFPKVDFKSQMKKTEFKNKKSFTCDQ